MEDSLSSSYDGPRSSRSKSRGRARDQRGGPEGDSMGVPNLPQPIKTKTKPKQNGDYSKRKSPGKHGDGASFESKRSRLSSEGCSMEEEEPVKVVRKKKAAPAAAQDLSWEMAVEKARGMPDGAMESADDDSDDMEEDEIDVDAPLPEPTGKNKTPKKVDEAKSSPLNVIQCVAKKLKPKKSKGSDTESPKKATKRKSEENLNDAADQKKAKAEKKEKKTQRKMHKNSNFDIGLRAKSMWEKLRRNDLPNEQRHKISAELHSVIKGKAKELIFAHDTSRVIQCMIKYGSQEHKNAIFEELKDHIVEMSKSKYAKFFVRKLLKYGTKAQRNYVFRKFYGNVKKLIRHKEAAEILECAYNEYATAAERSSLVEEFYGPSFTLFKTHEHKSLEQIIQSNPEKRDSILSNMKETLCALVEKSILQYSMVHRVFLEFFMYATDKLRTEMIETVREGIIHMLHTRDGSRVAMICLWHGTAKDRKVIIKSFKPYVSKISREEYGHLVLLAMFDVVDDTKLVTKAIVEEILKNVTELAQDAHARKVLLYLLCPRHTQHFHPDIVKILQAGDGNNHSKKEAGVRRRELLEAVSRPLVQYVSEHCKELVTNNNALLLLLAIITHAKTDPTAAMRAVAQLAAEPFVAGSLENHHIVEHTAGHFTLKKLIHNDATRISNGESVLFSGILLDVVPEGSLKSWAACNRGCFILINLIELKHQDITTKVRREVVAIKDSLKKMDYTGAQTLLSKLGLE